jgi:cold-inducible RNA-binding protein
MTNIFIANLDWEITSEDLKATFSAFGTVTYAHVVYDKDTKKSKGFGYVEMENSDEAIAAIQALKGLEVNGRALDVKIASPKGNRPEKKAPVEKKPFQRDNKFQKRDNFSGGSKRPRISNASDAQRIERKPYSRNED